MFQRIASKRTHADATDNVSNTSTSVREDVQHSDTVKQLESTLPATDSIITATASCTDESLRSASCDPIIDVALVGGFAAGACNDVSADIGDGATSTSSGPSPTSSPSTWSVDAVRFGETPFQPKPSDIPTMQCKNRTLHFQQAWFNRYLWLHYDASRKGVLCYRCGIAYVAGLLNIAKFASSAFITDGFRNWSMALMKFDVHERSECHKIATAQLSHARASQPINAQISDQKAAEQRPAHQCLLKIVSSVHYLARQGLAFRGRSEESGNFQQLMLLRAEDNPELLPWLSRKIDMTSWAVQNEISSMFSKAIQCRVCENIRSAIQFSIIVDGTQDTAGHEQEAVCI
jgi:hypothetical protein